MGDRTTVRIQIPKSHAPAFFKIAMDLEEEPTLDQIADECEYEDHEWDKDTWLDLSFTEINYAWNDEMEKAAKNGCVFTGDHSYGDQYSPSRFYSDGKEFSYWPCSYPSGDTYCIGVAFDGTVNQEEISNLQDFVAKLNAWQKKITEEGYNEPPVVP